MKHSKSEKQSKKAEKKAIKKVKRADKAKKKGADKKNIIHTVSFKFEAFLFALMIVSFSILTMILGNSVKKDNIETYTRFSRTNAEQISTTMSYYLDSYFKDLRVFTRSEAFYSGDIDTAREYMLDNTRLMGQDFDYVGIGGIDGLFYDSEGGVTNASNDAFYSEVVRKGRPQYISDPEYSDIARTDVFYISVPIVDNNNVFYGMFAAAVDTIFIQNEIVNSSSGMSGFICVLDSQGTIIAHTNREHLMKNYLTDGDEASGIKGFAEIATNMIMGQTGDGIINDTNIREISYIFYTPINGTSWSLAVAIPQNEVLASASNSSLTIALIAVIIAAGIIVLTSIYMRFLFKPLQSLKQSITEIAGGDADLTKKIFVKTKDEFYDVVKGFNKFTENLRIILSRIKDSKETLHEVDQHLQSTAQETEMAISHILSNINNVSARISTQNSSVGTTADSIDVIANNIESLDDLIEKQSAGVTDASTAVEQMIENIISVSKSTENMVSSFRLLEQHTNEGIEKQNAVNTQISTIEEQSKTLIAANRIISKIASETNLLAMNAAIEAAHAGEAGKGFSVVADEIRSLSETSTVQSKRIGAELSNIQTSISMVVNSSEEARSSFQSVTDRIQETAQLIQQIRNAMAESESKSRQITDALKMMNSSTSEVSTASSKISESTSSIVAEVDKLEAATQEIKDSMHEMATGANKVKEKGTTLTRIADEVDDSIEEIGSQIDLFTV